MTDVYQFHTPRRLYGANASATRRDGYVQCSTEGCRPELDTKAASGMAAARRVRPRNDIRLKVVSGFAAALAAIGITMGSTHFGTRAASAMTLGNNLLRAVGLAQHQQMIRLDAVKASVVKTADGDVLMVEGFLSNERAKTLEAPNLRVAVRGADRREMYVWIAHPPKAFLQPGERVTFRTRLETPPANGETVWVRAARPGEAPVPIEDRL